MLKVSWMGLIASLMAAALSVEESRAHDYWLQQEPLRLMPGDVCAVRLLVGDELDAELERPLQLDMTTRFEWYDGDTTVDLLASTPDSTLPVFHRRLPREGTSLLVMERKFHPIESTVERFLQFLEHEDRADLATRYADVAPETPLRRRYARGIKALFRTGDGAADHAHSSITKMTIEIRLLQSPHELEPGAEFSAHVQFQGKDLADQLVKALVRGTDGSVTVAKSHTNAEGIARFVLDRPGLWVLRATHLRESQESEMDWDTHYATFSFVYP